MNQEIEEQLEDAEDDMHGKYLIFYLNNQEFAIAIRYVVDIINIQPFTPIPNVPEYVRGITNLRGKVIPIIDVLLRFGKPAQEYNDRTCIIVVELDGMQVGLIIDQVAEVITLDDENISPPPAFNNTPETRFVCGIGKIDTGVKLILNVTAVLENEKAIELPGVQASSATSPIE